RKSMWIHPIHDRALSIREAARLQTFPDSFVFYGVKDSQYQQIGNAVPPILAKALAQQLCSFLDHGIAAHPDTFSLSTNC
ncbi:TPA: DNA cytosine methyltransferase, partial [Enterobacter kobei]